jgi:two-component system, OmpR family, response regulator
LENGSTGICSIQASTVFSTVVRLEKFMSRKMLVVEDDTETLAYIRKGFEEAGWSVEQAQDGRDGLYLATSGEYDLMVLDRNLPGMDGLGILKALRASGIEMPVVILSAMGQVDERVKGLRAGGDDYLVKPFSFAELHARVDALLKRKAPATAESLLELGDLRMDLISRTVTRNGTKLDLLPREFKLLEYFLRRKNQVVTRTMLLEGVWDYRFDPHTNIIDTHISRLRKTLETGFDRPILHTLRSVGYKLAIEP